MKDSRGALPGAPAVGVDAVISAWTADRRDKTLRKERSKEEETKSAPLVRVARDRELSASEEFDVFTPAVCANVKAAIVDTRLVLTWKGIKGKPPVEDRSGVKGLEDPELQQGLAGAEGCVSYYPCVP